MICLVSHDAGGAELLSSWAKNNRGVFLYNIKGPAVRIFKKKFKNFKNSNQKIIKKKTNIFITGTSKKSPHELSFIKYAKKRKIKSISIIDHWVNYKERFSRNNKETLPDEIWVTDKIALNLAKKIFNIRVILKKNYYLMDFVKSFNDLQKKNKTKKIILYLTTNTNNKKRDLTKLNHFFKKAKYYKDKKIPVVVKIHPSENISKYNSLIKKFKFVKFVKNYDLIKLLVKCKYVIGYNSMAMYLASKVKKKIFHADNNLKKNILPIKINKFDKIFKN